MTKWISILSGLLIVQLVLATALNMTGEDYAAFQPEGKLIVFDRQMVDGVSIEDGENSLVMEKRGEKWVLPRSGDFPADQGSVARLLDKLAEMEKGWPVATSSGAARRFKVAEGQFERKLALLSDEDPLAKLYVGTSPGFRKVHVRPAEEQAVFAAAFSAWEASAKIDDWIDKTALKFNENDVVRMEMPGYVLERKEGDLEVAGLGGQEETNSDAARGLLRELAGLSIQSLLGTEARPEYRQEAPMLMIRVTRKGGDVLSYSFSKPEEGSYYVLKRSDQDHYFKVAEYAVDPIKDATREELVQVKIEEASNELPVAPTDIKGTDSME